MQFRTQPKRIKNQEASRVSRALGMANTLFGVRTVSIQYIRPLEPLSALGLRAESIMRRYSMAVDDRICSSLSATAQK